MFDDAAAEKRWQRNVQECGLELLCVSQFTLYSRLKGNKPDFHLAMQGDAAQELYLQLLIKLGSIYQADRVKDGKFGAMMQVLIQNDGPVTIEIESPRVSLVDASVRGASAVVGPQIDGKMIGVVHPMQGSG